MGHTSPSTLPFHKSRSDALAFQVRDCNEEVMIANDIIQTSLEHLPVKPMGDSGQCQVHFGVSQARKNRQRNGYSETLRLDKSLT